MILATERTPTAMRKVQMELELCPTFRRFGLVSLPVRTLRVAIGSPGISKMDSTCATFWTASTILPTTRLVSQERWMNAHQTRLQQEVQHGLVQKVITNSVLSMLKKIFHIVIQFKRFFHFYLMQEFG